MKIKLLIGVLTFAFLQTSFAGEPVRKEKCGMKAHDELLRSKNPDFDLQRQKDELQLQQVMASQSLMRTSNVVYTIPVVVHVVYKTNAQNISNAQVQSQIDVLNQDFGRTNADASNTPAAFQSVASATNFQFCLASIDPTGAATNGIERRQTTTNSFGVSDDVKSYSTGGLDAWNVNKYLNIWVCNIGQGILGFGEFPTSIHSPTYGVVINYDAFGKNGSAAPPYNLGRTCTHEISHCFRLSHIWGDDNGTCSGSDNVADTPNQTDATFGCYTFPRTDACSPTSPGIMFMNYMDYSDDDCLNMFTANQASRMFSAISTYYSSLFTSDACQSQISGIESVVSMNMSIYPNPSSGLITIDMLNAYNLGDQIKVRVSDALGKIVKDDLIINPNGTARQIDLSSCNDGIYFITVYNNDFKKTERITLNK